MTIDWGVVGSIAGTAVFTIAVVALFLAVTVGEMVAAVRATEPPPPDLADHLAQHGLTLTTPEPSSSAVMEGPELGGALDVARQYEPPPEAAAPDRVAAYMDFAYDNTGPLETGEYTGALQLRRAVDELGHDEGYWPAAGTYRSSGERGVAPERIES